MNNLRQSIAEDNILKVLLLGIAGPLVIFVLGVLASLLKIEIPFLTSFAFSINTIYIFGISMFLLLLYVPIIKKTSTPKTKEAKVLIWIWLLLSTIIWLVFLIADPLHWTPAGPINVFTFESLAILIFSAGIILFIAGLPFLGVYIFLSRNSSQKRQVIIFSFASFIVASLLTGTGVYLLKPAKSSISIFPWDLKNGKQFSCSTKMGTTLFPKQNLKKDVLETIDGALFTNDKTKMAIEIDGKVLKMLTATSVEVGINKPAEFSIVKENEDELVAVYLESDNLFSGVDTFILHKKSGAAVWTKSSTSSLISKLPDAQAYYMECR